MHLESADGGIVETENAYYAFFTSGWTSTNAFDAPFSTGIPFDAGSTYGSGLPFSKDVLCIPVGFKSAYAPDTPFCTRIPVGTRLAYGSGIPFSTELLFTPGSCHLQITDQSTCSEHTDCDAVRMSCNGSISACTSKSASYTVWETVRCDDESVPPFSLAVGHDSFTHIEESYNSESSSDRSQVEDQLTCSQSAASTNGSHTRNQTHGDASDVGGVPETSEGHGDDVEDETVDASCSKSEHEETIVVFDMGLETPCVGHWIIIACILLRWCSRPKNLEKQPRYLRTRFELEALDTKPEVYRVSRSLRRCVALATIRKRFRAWRIDTKNEKHDRIGHVVGVAFLLIVMFQPVAEGSAVASVTFTSTNVTKHHDETALVNETDVHSDMNQLAALNVDPGLKKFIGSLVMGFQSELRELKRENAEMKGEIVEVQKENAQMKNAVANLQNENAIIKKTNNAIVELQKENAAVGAELGQVKTVNVGLQNRTQVLEDTAARAELKQVKREKDAVQNKTRVVQAELSKEKKRNAVLRVEVTEIQSMLYQFFNKTNTRLDQCEAKSNPFIQEMDHRQLQQTEQCYGSGMQTMLATCCPGGGGSGGHRRELQSDHGCAAFPDTCSVGCSAIYNDFYEDCHESIITSMPAAEQAEFDNFYGDCTEVAQQAAAVLEGASPAMIFHVVVVDQEAEQQAAMSNGGSGSGTSQFGPVNLPPAPASPSDGAVAAQEFRRICTTANLATCVPDCNAVTYGFLLSIEIDGRGTVMTCNVMDMLYAWVGQASLGGYIGQVFAAFFSSVISGASGTYMVKLTGNHTVHTDLTIQPGQVVVINGDRALPQPPTWGSGGFTVGESASLSLGHMQIDTVIQMHEGANQLTLDSCELTFRATMVLRVATATFANALNFMGGVTIAGGTTLGVPMGSSVILFGSITLESDAAATITNSILSFRGSAGLTVQSAGRVSIVDSTLSFPASVHTGLTVQSGGAATATSTTFQSTGDALPTVAPWIVQVLVSVEEGGAFTVADSQLVAADNSTSPMPCDGTGAMCDAPHVGTVEVVRPTKMRKGVPLVCDVDSAQCVGDMCAVVDCGVGGSCVSPLGTCACRSQREGYSGGRCETHTCCERTQPTRNTIPTILRNCVPSGTMCPTRQAPPAVPILADAKIDAFPCADILRSVMRRPRLEPWTPTCCPRRPAASPPLFVVRLSLR
eukprot:SAG31_NODE_1859_length_7052_cov_4.965051_1_plen_1196_part_00